MKNLTIGVFIGFFFWYLIALFVDMSMLSAATAAVGWANGVWGGGMEAVLGFLALAFGIPAAWWAYLPRYTAICCHDGEQWINLPGKWSATRGVAGDDEEQFTKQWLAKALGGKFITEEQARLPVDPKPVRHHVKLFGAKRGVYYVIGVRIFDSELLNKFSGRLGYAPVEYEVKDEGLPLF